MNSASEETCMLVFLLEVHCVVFFAYHICATSCLIRCYFVVCSCAQCAFSKFSRPFEVWFLYIV